MSIKSKKQFNMQAKALLLFCLQVLINQETYAQCFGYGAPNMSRHYGSRPYVPAKEPAFDVAPTGPYSRQLLLENLSDIPRPMINIVSDGLVINGVVSVAGSLPFLGSVAVEGELPMCGMGTVEFSSDSDLALIEMPERTSLINPYSLFPYY